MFMVIIVKNFSGISFNFLEFLSEQDKSKFFEPIIFFCILCCITLFQNKQMFWKFFTPFLQLPTYLTPENSSGESPLVDGTTGNSIPMSSTLKRVNILLAKLKESGFLESSEDEQVSLFFHLWLYYFRSFLESLSVQ